MKFIVLLSFTIVLILSVSISSRSFRKSHKKESWTVKDFIESGEIQKEKIENFKKLTETAGKTCKSQCTFHKATYFILKSDAFVCRCSSSWYASNMGDVWEEIKGDKIDYCLEEIAKKGKTVLIN